MWAAVIKGAFGLILAAVKWLWGGKQQAEGEAQGKAEQEASDAEGELNEAEIAHRGSDAVRDDPDSILHDPANSGPVRGRAPQRGGPV
jgi:hypothetical protein